MSRVDIIESVKAECYIEHTYTIEDEDWVLISGDDGGWRWKRSFEIELLPLAEFRSNGTSISTQEAYEIIWSRRRAGNETLYPSSLGETQNVIWLDRGLEQTIHQSWDDERQVFHQFTNKTKLVLDEIQDEVREGDVISVDVRFLTEEVRVDADRYLTGGGDWVVKTKCGSL
jgi:hypothetical protein